MIADRKMPNLVHAISVAFMAAACASPNGPASDVADPQSAGVSPTITGPARDKPDAGNEQASSVTAPARAEIVSAVVTTWSAVSADCFADNPPANADAQGRLLTVKVGGETRRVFVTQGHSVRCKERIVKEDPSANASLEPGLERIAGQAREDLAQKLAVEPAEIEISDAQWVTWRDSAAGCPDDGEVYMQVLAPGARVVLTVAGTAYHYHQVSGGAPFLCEHPSRIDPLPGPPTS